ncbi:MAG: ArgK protein [Rhodomicrobium sp.]|nr:MAG: ArgK protein [Rhodomicrobium sp.]
MELNSIEAVRLGGKRALSEALARAEYSFHTDEVTALLDEAYAKPTAHVVGFTGPPGVGKSTLINGLIKAWRGLERRVAVIAVDPSSHKTGGALLGDRTRMITDPEDQGVFVRSLASRGQLGGVSELTFPAIVLMRALYDVVIVETVGVGQSEADITGHADSVVLCVQPGSGDSLQFMKSGIMEIPDIAVVTKGDMEREATRAISDLKGALSLTSSGGAGMEPAVLKVSARRDEGMTDLIDAIDSHYRCLQDDNRLDAGRDTQAAKWLEASIRREYGAKGYALVKDQLTIIGKGPFKKQHMVTKGLTVAFKA